MKIQFLVLFVGALIISCNGKRNRITNSLKATKTSQIKPFAFSEEPKRIGRKPDLFHSFKKYTNLSDQFNLEVSISELDDIFVTSSISVSICDKNDIIHQKISVDALVVGPIIPVSHVRSYETKFNLRHKLEDPEYHGEIIVGDFNFDGRSDIAIVKGIPMSGTPWYEFYLQNENFEFVRDTYLTDVVKNLPQNLNPQKKSFMAYYHTGCCAQTYRYFKFDESGKCKLTYTKDIDLNDD